MSAGLLVLLGVIFLVVVLVAGWLRLRFIHRQAEQDRLLDLALQRVLTTERQRDRAEAEKRQAQRLVVLLSEPLKEWDLADFPAWADQAGFPGGALGPLNHDDARHLHATVQAYRLVAPELANVRMTAKTNDQARGRGWNDDPLAGWGVPADQAAEGLRRLAKGGYPASGITAHTLPRERRLP